MHVNKAIQKPEKKIQQKNISGKKAGISGAGTQDFAELNFLTWLTPYIRARSTKANLPVNISLSSFSSYLSYRETDKYLCDYESDTFEDKNKDYFYKKIRLKCLNCSKSCFVCYNYQSTFVSKCVALLLKQAATESVARRKKIRVPKSSHGNLSSNSLKTKQVKDFVLSKVSNFT